MLNGCSGNCLICGKCGNSAILEHFYGAAISIEPREGYGIAADIGTTSVVLALYDLTNGELKEYRSFMNPQRVYGSDVISRINAASNGGLEDMRRLITDALTSAVDELICSQGISDIVDMVIAGNTVMTHLLLGLPCDSLGVYPFHPACSPAERYNLPCVFNSCRIVPWLAAFVGGDITAGLLSVKSTGDECFLLIDLGTNGEMALYDRGFLTVASSAAGPAFEGASHGSGASGVIRDLASLIRQGYVDRAGFLAPDAPKAFSQDDIRALQLAKSAIRSGLEILLDTCGDSVQTVYLAGGIGQAMDVDDAITIGLIPPQLRGKTKAVGNTSLGGAARLLLTPKSAAADMEKLLAAAREINLAEHPHFNDLFMKHMTF